jgi:hypothetical protein
MTTDKPTTVLTIAIKGRTLTQEELDGLVEHLRAEGFPAISASYAPDQDSEKEPDE